MKKTGNSKLMQKLNRFIILNTIRNYGPISRSEIAERLKISPTTVTSAVRKLLRDKLVCEAEKGASRGGRKPTLIRFFPDSQFIIGVSITKSSIKITEMNLDAKVRRKEVFSVTNLTGQPLITYLLNLIERFLSVYHNLKRCVGISIISSGIIDYVKGVIRYNPKLKLKDIPLKKMVEEHFKLKTWLENDTNAIALAENNFGAYTKFKNLVYVRIGDGVGAGIIVNGSIFHGSWGGAGELGHVSIDKDGIRCDCGNKGCLENYVSWPAIYSKVISAITREKHTMMLELTNGDMTKITPTIFHRALKEGDRLAKDIMEEIATYLSIGIVDLVNLFNPDIIIIGGKVARDNQFLLSAVENLVLKRALNTLTDGLKICPASLSENFESMGAAAVLLQDVFHFSLSTQSIR